MTRFAIFSSGVVFGLAVFALPVACNWAAQKRLDSATVITEREMASPNGRYRLLVRDLSGPLTAGHRSEVSIKARARSGKVVDRPVMAFGNTLNEASWVDDHRVLIQVPDGYFSQLATTVRMDENNLSDEEKVYVDIRMTHSLGSSYVKRQKPNQSSEPTAMSVTPPAAHEPRQP